MIKGSGIAKAHIGIFGNYGTNESKRARVFYKNSIRIFNLYKCFQCPLSQICHAKIQSAKRISDMNENQFVKLNTDIEKVVSANSENYKSENYKFVNVESIAIDSKWITAEIIADVIRFTKESKLNIF